MLPAKNRLSTNKDFQLVKTKGKFLAGKFINLVVYFNKKARNSRFGIIITTKVSKRATKRNQIKRVIRKEILKYLNKGEFLKADILVIAKQKILDCDKIEIEGELSRLLSKIKTLTLK